MTDYVAERDKSKPLPGEDILVLSWDMYGLESVISVNEIYEECSNDEQNALLEALKSNSKLHVINAKTRVNSIVTSIMLRAQMNSQRFYEVYAIRVDKSITPDQMREMFDQNPQGMADLVRSRGERISGAPIPSNQEIKIR